MAIEIDISVRAATLVLSDNAGNVRASGGTEIVWKTSDKNRKFTVEFFPLQIGGEESPFICGATCGTVSCEQPFKVQLKKRASKTDLGAYKYSVSTGSLVLDPIIVMGED